MTEYHTLGANSSFFTIAAMSNSITGNRGLRVGRGLRLERLERAVRGVPPPALRR
jgi:hypothetical protein